MSVIAIVDMTWEIYTQSAKGWSWRDSKITDSPTELATCNHAARWGRLTQLCNICARGLVEPIKQVIASGKPFLGICLGFKFYSSAVKKSKESGLGCCGTVRRFASEPEITIPHMGWNQLEIIQLESGLWQQLSDRGSILSTHTMLIQLILKFVRQPSPR